MPEQPPELVPGQADGATERAEDADRLEHQGRDRERAHADPEPRGSATSRISASTTPTSTVAPTGASKAKMPTSRTPAHHRDGQHHRQPEQERHPEQPPALAAGRGPGLGHRELAADRRRRADVGDHPRDEEQPDRLQLGADQQSTRAATSRLSDLAVGEAVAVRVRAAARRWSR